MWGAFAERCFDHPAPLGLKERVAYLEDLFSNSAGNHASFHAAVRQELSRNQHSFDQTLMRLREQQGKLKEELNEEVNKELRKRDADIAEIQRLVEHEKSARFEHLGCVKELLANELHERQMHLTVVEGLMARDREHRQALLDEIRSHFRHECDTHEYCKT